LTGLSFFERPLSEKQMKDEQYILNLAINVRKQLIIVRWMH
jgi:hypothetical protein